MRKEEQLESATAAQSKRASQIAAPTISPPGDPGHG
jgi:hypothetical protein